MSWDSEATPRRHHKQLVCKHPYMPSDKLQSVSFGSVTSGLNQKSLAISQLANYCIRYFTYLSILLDVNITQKSEFQVSKNFYHIKTSGW